ncbi:AAA family ATPase [Actinomadura livida]|nr:MULTISPECIES: AAA family ATPase [Actinomadura]MBB4773290.1 pilus assembly protein CpaE [Actinomadura catellatispora]
MSIQILLGIEDRDLAASLTGQFRELPDIKVVAVETSSNHVAGTVATLPQLDVVLVHQALGPLPALDLIRELVVRRPQLAVILIADEATAETLSAAMAAGARGVISNEPTLSELQNRVQQASEWSRTMRRHFTSVEAPGHPGRLARLVTLCGAKGGVGTTTLAIHLAIAASSAGRTVCLVDMDLQNGDIPGYLDVQHRHSIADLAAAAGDLDGAVVAEALFVHPSGPHLLLAPGQGEDAEEVSARAVRQILTVVRSRYDVVIVDGGTHIADANAMAVELADEAVIVTTPDVPALRSARRLARMFARLAIRREEDVSVLLTRQDRRNEIQPDLARKMVGSPLRGVTVPAVFRALEEAANTGSPGAVKNADFRKAVGRAAADLGLLGAAPEQETVPPSRRKQGDAGAVAVEFAGILPLIVLVFLLVWQVVLIGLTSTYSSHAANEAARAVAVLGYDKGNTEQARANREEVRRRAVERVKGDWKDREHLTINVVDGYAVVTIDTPILIPGLRSSWGIETRTKIVDEGEG